MEEIKTIIIIDDKDLEYTTLGMTRKDLYTALVRMLKCKWEDISQYIVLFKKSEDNKASENNEKIFNMEFKSKSLENFETLKDYVEKLEEISGNQENSNNEYKDLIDLFKGIDKEKTLILLDVLLTDDNAEKKEKKDAIAISSSIYKSLKNKNWHVLYYSTAVTDYIGKISDEIYDGVVEMDWYDVRSSAIEIMRRAKEEPSSTNK